MGESYFRSRAELLDQEFELFTHIRGQLKQLLEHHGGEGDSEGEVSFPDGIPLSKGWKIFISEFEEGAFCPQSLALREKTFKDLLVLDLLASDEHGDFPDEFLDARDISAPVTLLISAGEIIDYATGAALTIDQLADLRQDVDTIITPYVEANFPVQ